MTVPRRVLSLTFAVILLWHCPITSSTVIFKCCHIVTGLPRTEERNEGEHSGVSQRAAETAVGPLRPLRGGILGEIVL